MIYDNMIVIWLWHASTIFLQQKYYVQNETVCIALKFCFPKKGHLEVHNAKKNTISFKLYYVYNVYMYIIYMYWLVVWNIFYFPIFWE